MKLILTLAGMVICMTLHSTHCLAQEAGEVQMPWAIGGVGGAYLLVNEPGELEVEVFKQDINVRDWRTSLRAILTGPDRAVLDEAVIPHTGGRAGQPPGPVQSVVLRAQADRPGIYPLNITTTRDRYGLNLAWSLRTNAAAYVVETSRGHRDERHMEPIVLLDADRPADVCFLPRAGEFEIEVEALPPDVEQLTLYDENGVEVLQIPVAQERGTAIRQYLRLAPGDAPEGSVKVTIPAAEGRGAAPWRLHFPRGRAFVQIDGVTRWDPGDLYRDLSVWSPDPDSWFPLLQHRWLISPYQRSTWGAPGAEGSMVFRVHNNSTEATEVALALEFPGAPWPAELSADRVALDPGQVREVEVSFTAPAEGETALCHVRATPEATPEVTTYATLTVRGGESPLGEPLDLPLVLGPYAHENRQFGYLPEYAVNNQVYFDPENRPFVVDGGTLFRTVDGEWVATRLANAVVGSVPEVEGGVWVSASTKIAFDADNDVYLLGRSGSNVALLRSEDGGETFTAYVIAGRENEPRAWDFENFTGHNIPQGPPPVIRNTRMARDTEARLRWRSVNELELIVGEKTADGGIEFSEPMLLSDTALGFSMHSGIPSSLVSRGAKVHVVWGEATDPAVSREEIPGVPAYVITYDRETGELGEPVFMSFGPPPNDGHNTPSITMDSQGYLHVVVGTHGAPFQYLQSLEPNDAYGGWTEATRTSETNLSQTYVGLVCGADDTLHLVFRLWMSGQEHLDGASWAALAYQSKRPGEDWSDARVLVAPPFSEYSIYYHRLTVDQAGALYVSYDYWSTMWFYRMDQRGAVAAASGRPGSGWGRTVLTSPDGGGTWALW